MPICKKVHCSGKTNQLFSGPLNLKLIFRRSNILKKVFFFKKKFLIVNIQKKPLKNSIYFIKKSFQVNYIILCISKRGVIFFFAMLPKIVGGKSAKKSLFVQLLIQFWNCACWLIKTIYLPIPLTLLVFFLSNFVNMPLQAN